MLPLTSCDLCSVPKFLVSLIYINLMPPRLLTSLLTFLISRASSPTNQPLGLLRGERSAKGSNTIHHLLSYVPDHLQDEAGNYDFNLGRGP